MIWFSEPQDLRFADEVDVFESVEFTTGRLPDGSPVQVEFRLDSGGGLSAAFEAVSDVSWPDALTQTLTGTPGGGSLSFLTDLRLEALVYVDLFDLYEWQDVVWSDGLYLLDDAAFDPLLLPGSSVAEVALGSDGLGIDTIHYDLALFTGVSLGFTLDVFPRAEAAVRGVSVATVDPDEPDDVLATLTTADGTAIYPVPAVDPGVLSLMSTFTAHLSAGLSVVFQPAIAVNTPVGDFELARFDVPVELLSYEEDRAFPAVTYEHPLPALAVPFASHDFGELEPGDLANVQVPLENVGDLDLEGVVRIEGDPAFTVYPEFFLAGADVEDGVVVTYAPADEGTHTAMLVIESNDPAHPALEIPLRGGAVAPEVDLYDENEHVSVDGCGCASPGGVGGWVGVLAAALIVGRRRR